MFTRMLACYVFTGMALCFFRMRSSCLRRRAAMPRRGPGHTGGDRLSLFHHGRSDGQRLYVTRRTGWKPYITLASAAVVLVLYLLLIPLTA